MLADLPFVIRTLVADRRGASSAEYALVAALISIAAITAIGIVGQEIPNKFGHCRQRLQLMQRAIAAARRFVARARGAALVGYTSLMLLFAVAAVTMLGHANGSAKPTRNANITSPD